MTPSSERVPIEVKDRTVYLAVPARDMEALAIASRQNSGGVAIESRRIGWSLWHQPL